MENQYPNQLEDTNLYDEPSDDDLKRIEDELSDFLDLFWTQNILRRIPPILYWGLSPPQSSMGSYVNSLGGFFSILFAIPVRFLELCPHFLYPQ